MRPSNEFSVRRLLVILLLPAILALLVFGWHPAILEPPAGEVELNEVVKQEQQLWVDVRSEAEYTAGRVKHAFWLTPEEWSARLPMLLQLWQPGDQVIVYCSSGDCQTSREVAFRLRAEVGLEQVFYLKGGWEELIHSSEKYGIHLQVGVAP